MFILEHLLTRLCEEWGCEENGVQSRGWSPVRKLLQSSEWEGMGASPQVMAVGMEGSRPNGNFESRTVRP